MTGTRRSPLAVIYTALCFGVVLATWLRVPFGALQALVSPSPYLILCGLLLATVILSFTLLRRSGFEERLAKQSTMISGIATMCALGFVCFVFALLMHYGLLSEEQVWVSLLLSMMASTLIVLVAILFTKPSRLERYLTVKFDTSYRFVGYGVLVAGLVFALYKFYQYYLLTHVEY